MTSFSTSRHPDDGSPHVRVSVFAGPDRDHRANVGILTFRRGDGEDDELIYRVEDRYLTAEVERLTAGRAFIQETLAQTLTRAETAEAKVKAVEALADEMGSGFPYVRIADIRRVLSEPTLPPELDALIEAGIADGSIFTDSNRDRE